MAPRWQKTPENLIAYPQRHFSYTLYALSDNTRYSTQNNNTTATLARFHFTFDGKSVFVTRNHICILTTKIIITNCASFEKQSGK